MPQQLACPNCQMVVNVFEAFATERTLCPSCQSEMKPFVDYEEEPVVAEPIEPPRFVAVELDADASPPRPTVVVPHAPPPQWKPTPVARAWITVARGLDLQRCGTLIVLMQALGTLVVLALARDNLAWVGFLLTYLAVGATGILFVIGRLCCYRVPPRTGARLWMGIACASTAIAVMLALLTIPDNFVGPDAKLSSVMVGVRWAALGSALVVELMFLWAIARIMQFVKRPGIALLTGITAATVAFAGGLWIAHALNGTNVRLAVFESALAGVCVLYLVLLRAAQNAVLTRTPEEKGYEQTPERVEGGTDGV